MNRIPALLLFLLLSTLHTSLAQTIGGIGAVLQLDTAKDGTTLPRIKSTAPNTPAALQNLPEGSYIIKVNDQPCKNRTLEDVVSLIRGEAGTTVDLSLADNPQGKKARDYKLTRANMQFVAPPDPVTAFNDECEKEVKQLKRTGHKIAKSVSSDCGDYYFSFDAEQYEYKVKVMIIGTKDAAANTAAVVYSSSDEARTTPLKLTGSRDQAGVVVSTLEGTIAMKANSAGVVKTNIKGSAGTGTCKGMYIIVYR